MSQRNIHRAIVTLMIAAAAPGCSTAEKSPTTSSTAVVHSRSVSDAGSAVRYTRSLEHLFAGTLSKSTVSTGRAFLEAQGYTYVDSNSLILVRYNQRDAAFTPTPSAFVPNQNRAGQILGKAADTVVWLAFENPLHDPGNHTALITIGTGDLEQTVLVELDVSTDVPGVIREGKIVGGQFVPGDVGTEGWLSCMGAGLLGSAVRCGLTNCAWGSCMGVGGTVTTVVCTAVWAFGGF